MNSLTKFEFNTKEVRVVAIKGEPWFIAKDLCEVLNISKHRDAVSRLEDDEKSLFKVDTLGGKQETVIVSESGMYSLVMFSRKPEAKPFRQWLTKQITEIRKSSDFLRFTQENPQYADKTGFVYLAMTPNRWCKIGMTKQPYKRMSSLQTGTPLEIILVHRIFTFDMIALEKDLHEYYQAYWMRGEWFDLPQECIDEFPLIANQLDTTLETLCLSQ
jgi:prophage antirepressor-like protein